MTSESWNCTFPRNRTSMRRTAVCLRNHTLKDRPYPPTFFYFKIIYLYASIYLQKSEQQEI